MSPFRFHKPALGRYFLMIPCDVKFRRKSVLMSYDLLMGIVTSHAHCDAVSVFDAWLAFEAVASLRVLFSNKALPAVNRNLLPATPRAVEYATFLADKNINNFNIATIGFVFSFQC